MDHLKALAEASALFADRLAAVGPDAWGQTTPCPEWDVRALVNHVVAGEKMTSGLLAGRTSAEVLPTLAGDHLESDPVGAFRAANAAALEAFGEEGALDRTVHHPAGDIDGRTFAGFRIGDLTVHSWDLARAIGGDERLPSGLVDGVLETLEPMRPFIGSIGVFGAGPSPDLPADADPQTRMLDLSGRRP